jgi:hypothetical protein
MPVHTFCIFLGLVVAGFQRVMLTDMHFFLNKDIHIDIKDHGTTIHGSP